jgi:hypothetical protein
MAPFFFIAPSCARIKDSELLRMARKEPRVPMTKNPRNLPRDGGFDFYIAAEYR